MFLLQLQLFGLGCRGFGDTQIETSFTIEVLWQPCSVMMWVNIQCHIFGGWFTELPSQGVAAKKMQCVKCTVERDWKQCGCLWEVMYWENDVGIPDDEPGRSWISRKGVQNVKQGSATAILLFDSIVWWSSFWWRMSWHFRDSAEIYRRVLDSVG